MSDTILYLTGILISMAVCVGLIFFIQKRFQKLLVDLTGNQDRAGFWMRFSNILIVLTTLVFAMSVTPQEDYSSVFFQITRQVKWAFVGLIISLVVVGIIMINFIPKGKS